MPQEAASCVLRSMCDNPEVSSVLATRSLMAEPTHAGNNVSSAASDRARATRDQFELLHSILDSMGDGIVVADEQGRFLLFNPAAESILGLGASDIPPEQWANTYGVF